MLRILVHEPAQGLRTLSSAAEARAALDAPGAVLWVDIQGRTPEGDAVLSEVFGFHPLAIEDVYKERHRPKVEDYDDYLYLILRGLAPEWRLDEVATVELDLFLGKAFVVTHHQHPLASVADVRQSLEAGRVQVMERGAAFLAHAIIDRLVDRFLPLGDAFAHEIDVLEKDVLKGQDRLLRIVEIMGGLQQLRRLAVAQRDILAKLAAGTYDEVPEAAEPFFRDVHEHTVQLADTLEAERDELNNVFAAYHSLSAHRMNEIMKVLTLISTIMLPLTFLAGVYGMNFDEMPELHWKYGYATVWGLFVVLSIGMTLYFKRRGWL